MKLKNISKYIDHTNLKPESTSKDIENLCSEALQYDFATVCVNPCFVNLCKKLLKNSTVKVCTVIGFPLGANPTEVKIFEAEKAINDGTEEIDIVINIGKLKENNHKYVKDEISKVVALAKANGVLTKVIIETCLLTNNEKMTACEIVIESGADFVKTSTGFSTGGAKVEDIKLLKSITKGKIGIKASGGIKSYETLIDMINAGATRIGTSSGVKIINEFLEEQKSR